MICVFTLLRTLFIYADDITQLINAETLRQHSHYSLKNYFGTMKLNTNVD